MDCFCFNSNIISIVNVLFLNKDYRYWFIILHFEINLLVLHATGHELSLLFRKPSSANMKIGESGKTISWLVLNICWHCHYKNHSSLQEMMCWMSNFNAWQMLYSCQLYLVIPNIGHQIVQFLQNILPNNY